MRIRQLVAALAVLALTLVLPLDVGAQGNPRYWLQVVGDDGSVVTSGYCRPVNAGLATEPTVYTTATLGTAKSIPISISATTGECEWYATAGQTYDVLVSVTGGEHKGASTRLLSFTGVGRAVVSKGHADKMLLVPFSASATAATRTSAFTVNPGFLIKDVVVETKTAVAASTILVGLTGANTIRILCNAIATWTVGSQDCLTTSLLLHAGSALSVTYSTQGHATAGYLYLFGQAAANAP